MSLEDIHNYYQENLGRIEGNYHRIINNEFLFDEYKYKRPIKCL